MPTHEPLSRVRAITRPCWSTRVMVAPLPIGYWLMNLSHADCSTTATRMESIARPCITGTTICVSYWPSGPRVTPETAGRCVCFARASVPASTAKIGAAADSRHATRTRFHEGSPAATAHHSGCVSSVRRMRSAKARRGSPASTDRPSARSIRTAPSISVSSAIVIARTRSR